MHCSIKNYSHGFQWADVDDVASLAILQKMSSNNFFICLGIEGYYEYKESIGYDSKNVVHVVLPTDTVRHVTCEKLFDKRINSKVAICKSSLSLKMYLTKLKRKHESDIASTSHTHHQLSSSVYSYDLLSPASKKTRMVNIRKENKVLRVKVARLQACQVNSHLEVNDDQAQELTKLVHAVTSSEAGQNELENIFCEAEEFREEGDSMLRNISEDETSDIQDFMDDQLVNGKEYNYIIASCCILIMNCRISGAS